MCLTAADGATPVRSKSGAGFTLVEVLVAAAMTSVVIAASYGWLWSVAALARRTDDRVQATTLADAAARGIEGDVHASIGVTPPPAGRDPALSLTLVHHHTGTASESLLIVWDAARRVVWRNASGTYVADHVGSFGVQYRLRDGRVIRGAEMTDGEWTIVTAVCVELAASVGSAVVSRRFETSVGAS
jgi:prepilin-type N-terminal cleavage/methylation domain-containing protein